MDKETRGHIQSATQDARKLLEAEFASQLEGTFDVLPSGEVKPHPGPHLDESQRLVREKIVAAIDHYRQMQMTKQEAVAHFTRSAAFTVLNRFVALKMLEARELVQECVSKGPESKGFREFTSLSPALTSLGDAGYRVYLECIFDELSTGVKVLFDRSDEHSLLWPKRQAFTELLAIWNQPALASVWGEDETIGWVYQFFNSGEERKQMRDESQVPRNSRELAVRNQFFTPRYVVEFLTDNTLGRTWLQMHGPTSALRDSCRYHVEIDEENDRRRRRKDPRDLKVLDPACGSGHFLLYCFDLLLTIYAEGWSAGDAPKSALTGRTLRDDYATLEDLQQAAPALILEHCLHGVDIDPRAAQIAALALWLKAQRAWKDEGVPASQRPSVRRTHIVVAEPMPGATELVEEFAASLEPPLLRDLFRRIVTEMKLAGELGSLLPIEKELATEITKAREQYSSKKRGPAAPMLPGMAPPREQGELDLSGIDDDEFFAEAETRILLALHNFAETAAGGAGVRRRLFAGDAAHGMALLELLRSEFDVVLMNPPFGLPTPAMKRPLESQYSESWKDLYAAFAERGVQLLAPAGLLGIISPTTWLYSRQLRAFRHRLLAVGSPELFAELGGGVMDDAAVEACLWTATPQHRESPGRYLDLLDEDTDARSHLLLPGNPRWRSLTPSAFAAIEDAPLCHHLPQPILELWSATERRFDPAVAEVVKGNTTFNDFRFLRLWWEVSARDIDVRWQTYRAGGDYQPFASDATMVANWERSGRENRCFGTARHGSDAQVMQSSKHWGRAGIAYPRVGTAGLGMRVARSGQMFSECIYIGVQSDDDRWPLVAFLNTPIVTRLYEAHGRHRKTETIAVKDLPFSEATQAHLRAPLAPLAKQAWALANVANTADETHRTFEGLPISENLGVDVAAFVAQTKLSLATVVGEIDQHVRGALGIPQDILGWKDLEKWAWTIDQPEYCFRVLSYLVGAAFRRFHRPLLDGCSEWVSDPQTAFDPLQHDSVAMRSSGSASSPELVCPGFDDDLGSERDLAGRLLTTARRVGGDALASQLDAVASTANSTQIELRVWLSRRFFGAHIKRYSANARKAPIYWQLAPSSARYSVWVYIHQFNSDTLHQVLDDVVTPKLQHEERKLVGLRVEAASHTSSAQRAEIEEQGSFVEELKNFRDEVARVAPLCDPDLDDGVILNAAPLWRLFQHTPSWAKECKSKWDELVDGEHDWAHIAMRLWPERVVPKCANDRSLAIAHGLEDTFWVEGNNGKWAKRIADPEVVTGLIEERTRPAVKAALQSLLEAGAATPVRGRSRAPRATRALAEAPPAIVVEAATVRDRGGHDEVVLQQVVASIRAKPDGASKADVLAAVPLSDGQWNAAIQKLMDDGQVERTGNKRAARYTLARAGRVS